MGSFDYNPVLSVRANRRIEQSPLCDAPCVPAGALGSVEDDLRDSDGLVAVDFGKPYGTVLCYPGEIE